MKENRIEIKTGLTRSWVYKVKTNTHQGTRFFYTQGSGFTFRISRQDYDRYLKMAVKQ